MSKVPVRNKNVGLGTDMSNFFFLYEMELYVSNYYR